MRALVHPSSWHPYLSTSTEEEIIGTSANRPYMETSTADDAIACLKPGEGNELLLHQSFMDTGTSPYVTITTTMKPSVATRFFDSRLRPSSTSFPLPSSSKVLYYWAGDEPEDITRLTDNLGEMARRVVGDEGVERVQEFKLYEKGWDSGQGEPLSSISIALTETFLNLYPKLSERQPSVFLSRSGNLQLGWEDKENNPVEIEFFPHKVEYYIGPLDEEGEIYLDPKNPSEGIREIITKIQISCHE
jgi:hypothetical protein